MRIDLVGRVKRIEKAWYKREPNLIAVDVDFEGAVRHPADSTESTSASMTIYLSEEDARNFAFGQRVAVTVESP